MTDEPPPTMVVTESRVGFDLDEAEDDEKEDNECNGDLEAKILQRLVGNGSTESPDHSPKKQKKDAPVFTLYNRSSFDQSPSPPPSDGDGSSRLPPLSPLTGKPPISPKRLANKTWSTPNSRQLWSTVSSSRLKRQKNISESKSIHSAATEPSLGAAGSGSPIQVPRCTTRPPPKKIKKYYRRQSDLIESYKSDFETLEKLKKFDSVSRASVLHSDSRRGTKDTEMDIPASELEVDTTMQPFIKKQMIPPIITIDDEDAPQLSNPMMDVQRKSTKRATFLAKITLLINVLLMLMKAVAVGLSGSFSIISSLVDSAVDITSGLAIWLTSRAIKHRDPYLYPRGRTRLEPLALVIVSVIMAVASIQMIIHSSQAIVSGAIQPVVEWPTIGIMLATIVVKFCLMMACLRYGGDNPSTRVLGQDHRNDCVSNAVAVACAFLAERYWLYLDPIGAIVVSLYIAGTWFATGYDQMVRLSGRAADPQFINRILTVCLAHDARIEQIDTVHVYHYGTNFLVELHIVLDAHMCLRDAHDLSEPLQRKLEHLPYVERAFVHIDYESEHRPEDEHLVV